jgi:putative spermidine/putrescine transport system permease protein
VRRSNVVRARPIRANLPWAALRGVVVALYVFLLVPIIITVTVSFNAVNQSKFPPLGFSFRWWADSMSARWLQPLAFSIELGLITAVVSVFLGMPLAFALVRYRFPGRDALATLALGPLVLPALVTGIGLLQFMHAAGFSFLFGFPILLIGHIIICLPFSVRCIGISLRALPANLEQAALSLGATPIVVLREIVLPLIKSGIFAGAVFSFIHSFSDYSISLFLSRPGTQPITITILSFLEYGFAPTLAAVAALTLIVPLVLIAVVQRVFRIGDFLYAENARD